ncbi:MAG: flavodoxin [Burkholderiales bacterium]|jgi:hypothetical protein|nr:flavodoxin [Burkholderiales bacterium]
MSKILVVTYSFTGTSTRLAELMCRSRVWKSAQVTERSPRKHLVTLRCAIDSLFRLKPPICYNGPDPAEFDLVVLVAPIWLRRVASPMRSFAASFRAVLPRVAVVSVMGGSGGQNAAAEIGSILDKAPLMSTTFTMREVEDGSYASRLLALATAVDAATDGSAVLRPYELSPETAG